MLSMLCLLCKNAHSTLPVTLIEAEKSSAFASSSPHIIIALSHRLYAGYMSTPTFLRARSAGDAAFDKRD